MVNKEQIRNEWKIRVNQFRNSGMTMTKWCNENEFKVHQLQYWLEKYKDETVQQDSITNTQWVTVNLTDTIKEENLNHIDHQNNKNDELNIKIGKCTVKVKSGFDSLLLLDVVKVLTSVC